MDEIDSIKLKQDAFIQSEAFAALSNEIHTKKVNHTARGLFQKKLLMQLPELGLIEAIISKKCKSIIAFMIPGNSPLGIKTMNDSLIGPSLNNVYVINPQIKILKDAFAQAFSECQNKNKEFVIISNNFKGIVLATSIINKSRLAKIINRVLDITDIEMKQVLQNALEIGLQFWKSKQSSLHCDALLPIKAEIFQITLNVSHALIALARPNWIFEAHAGISRIKPLDDYSNFEEISFSAMVALAKAFQARALARSRFNKRQLDLNVKSRRFCYCDDRALLRVAQKVKNLRTNFFENRKSKSISQGDVKLTIMKKHKSNWSLNPDLIRLHRKGQLTYSELKGSEKKCLEVLHNYLDLSRAFSAKFNFTYHELPKVHQRLKVAHQVFEKLTNHTLLMRRDLGTIKKLLNKDIAGYTMSESNRASSHLFFNFLDGHKHRIYLNADVIDLGLRGRLRSIEELHLISGIDRLSEIDFFKTVMISNEYSVNARRSLYREVGKAYLSILKKLPIEKMTTEILREIDATRRGALTLIAGDEITLSMHPIIRTYLPELVKTISNRTNSRIVISETLADAKDYHEKAMQQADLGISVLKKYELQNTYLLMRVKEIADKITRTHLAALILSCDAASLFAYVSPSDDLRLYVKGSGREVAPNELNHEFIKLQKTIQFDE